MLFFIWARPTVGRIAPWAVESYPHKLPRGRPRRVRSAHTARPPKWVLAAPTPDGLRSLSPSCLVSHSPQTPLPLYRLPSLPSLCAAPSPSPSPSPRLLCSFSFSSRSSCSSSSPRQRERRGSVVSGGRGRGCGSVGRILRSPPRNRGVLRGCVIGSWEDRPREASRHFECDHGGRRSLVAGGARREAGTGERDDAEVLPLQPQRAQLADVPQPRGEALRGAPHRWIHPEERQHGQP